MTTVTAVLEGNGVRIIFPDAKAKWPTIVAQLKSMLREQIDGGRCGGVSLALHPQDERCDHEVTA
jgi:hypothetical protein